MDSTSSGCIIINELTQGMELAMQLNSILSSESSSDNLKKQVLIQQIISSYDRALLMVNLGGQTPPMLGQPESFVPLDESPRNQDVARPFDDQREEKVVSDKRKAMPTWRNQIRISTENGFEGNTADRYNWRKYGQKDILGSKFPRSYYRCTYRYLQHCMARKQVQRTNDNPTVFDITYKGNHTCNSTAPSTVTPLQQSSSDQRQHDQVQQNILQKSGETSMTLSNLIGATTTSDLDAIIVPSSFSFPPTPFENYQQFPLLNETDYGVLQGYSHFSSSLGTSGSNYQHQDDSNLSRVVTTTNCPLANTFTADPLQDLSQDFAFNNQLGYFNI